MKLIMALPLFALVTMPLLAQQKVAAKKPGAKAMAAAPVTAPAAQAAAAPMPAADATATASSLTTTALIWGGYNLPASDEFNKVASGLTKGGIAGGVEFLVGTQWIRAGVAAAYIPIYVYTSDTGKDTKALMPFEGVVNIYLFGFYAGGRGGYVVDVGSTTVTGQNYQKTNGTQFGGQLGYQYALGRVAIDLGVIMTFAHTEAAAVSGKAGAHADYTNITPRMAIQYTF
jgi:hypothetical protein